MEGRKRDSTYYQDSGKKTVNSRREVLSATGAYRMGVTSRWSKDELGGEVASPWEPIP